MKIRKCTICGQEFESYNGREVCSDKCLMERKKKYEKVSNYRRYHGLSCEPMHYTCQICGKEFEGLREKYCSDECREIARKVQVRENNKMYYNDKRKSG